MWRKYFFPERANIVSERLHNAVVASAVVVIVVLVVVAVAVVVALAVVVLSSWSCLFKKQVKKGLARQTVN